MDEQSSDYWESCAELATWMRQQAAERETIDAASLAVLEQALWTAYIERVARSAGYEATVKIERR